MDLNIAEELKRAFDLATLRKEARGLKSSRQWQKAFQLDLRCQVARSRETKLYLDRYDTRVEVARRRLIDEAAKKSFDFKPRWGGDDRFDAEATLRQAQRQVRHEHERRIARIDDYERQRLKAIVEQSIRENNLMGMVREEFGRAVDRRTGADRRAIWERQWRH